jgi:putative transposase
MRTAVSTPITRNKQGRRSAGEWRALMRAFSHSGETRTQFCERHGVALSTFAWWRSHLRHESTAVSETSPAPASALFVELTQAEPPVATVSARWDVELELGSGVFLRLRRGAC